MQCLEGNSGFLLDYSCKSQNVFCNTWQQSLTKLFPGENFCYSQLILCIWSVKALHALVFRSKMHSNTEVNIHPRITHLYLLTTHKDEGCQPLFNSTTIVHYNRAFFVSCLLLETLMRVPLLSVVSILASDQVRIVDPRPQRTIMSYSNKTTFHFNCFLYCSPNRKASFQS